VARRKSQAELDVLQNFNDAMSDFRQTLQDAGYRRSLEKSENISLVENYLNGKMALVCDLVVTVKGDRKFSAATEPYGDCPSRCSLLILHNNAFDGNHLSDWEQEQVLVSNIKIVKAGNSFIPTSTVRSYVGNYPFKKDGRNRIYFSAFKRTFQFFHGRVKRELGVIVRRADVSLNDTRPCVIQRGSEVVDGISNNDSQLPSDSVSIGQEMLELLQAGSYLRLDNGNISIWNRSDSLVQFRDVLIGPLDFELCRREPVDHEAQISSFG
jgi:hypothetical protein